MPTTTANPYRPQGYSIPQGVTLSNKKLEKGVGVQFPCAAWGLADNWSPSGELLHFSASHVSCV